MLQSSASLLKKPIFLLFILAILFIIITLRMAAMPIPSNEVIVKMAYDLVARPLPKEKDWHDYRAIYLDARRTGNGEQGKSAKLSTNIDRQLEQQLMQLYGYNALLSDVISLYRGLPDMRDEGCLSKKYLYNLPKASIIIPLYNEYLSVLLRTLHSIVNRTPRELLEEIILIDDGSESEFLGKQLDEYVARYFDKVKIIRLPAPRLGLISARLIAARNATAEVLVFLDSHIEVNHNWLPPLLEPIVRHKHTVICPLIDKINHNNFEYKYKEAGRGGFDWSLSYRKLKLLPVDLLDRTQPYRNPIIGDNIFAISAKYFWELNGYDNDLNNWGAEEFALSFKIWMCGGQLLNAPCSRVGHLQRDDSYIIRNAGDVINLRFKNIKRIAEIWMDEYKNNIYEYQKDRFETIDTGDLTVQRALRKKLNCSSFKWYMEEIAFDTLKANSFIKEPPFYAHGIIQNVGLPHLCIDTKQSNILNKRIGLNNCYRNITHRSQSQIFELNWQRELRQHNTVLCLAVPEYHENAFVIQSNCQDGEDNTQLWYYDYRTKLLKHGNNGKYCLEAALENKKLFVNFCQSDNLNMQWNFDVVNKTAIDGVLL